MTSIDDRSAPAVYRLSRETWAELASGGGTRETISFLAGTQVSRRLWLLKVLVESSPPDLRPLPPVDVAWDVMDRAQALDPQKFEAVLTHPQIGNWAAYALGGHLDGGLAEPPWATFGYLHAVALVAAARTGQTWQTRVPLLDGRVTLPGLGQARFDAADRWDCATAATADGTICLRYGPASVTVPDDPERDADGWWGLRSLTVGTDPQLRVVLDDIDPFRNLGDRVDPERLTTDEVAHWGRMLDRAWKLLTDDDRDAASALARAVSSLAPLARADQSDGYEIRSASTAEAFGAIVLSTPHDPVDLAATLVHEFRHMKLGCLMHLRHLHEGAGRPRLYAPWRDDPRPLGGLLQGIYAFHGIAAFYRARAGATTGAERRIALYNYALTRRQTAEGMAEARASGDLTDLGIEFLSGLAAAMEPWFCDDIPADLDRLVGLAAGAHRLTWLLRYRRPAQEAVAALVDAWSAGNPIDETATSVASVVPPAEVPHPSPTWSRPIHRAVNRKPSDATPQAALIRGDAVAAKAGFSSQLLSDPDNIVAWTGLALACAESGPTEAAHPLSARPDLLAAAFRQLVADGTAPHPEDLAAWAGGLTLNGRQ